LLLRRRLEQLDERCGLIRHWQAEAGLGGAAALQEVAHHDEQLQGNPARDDDQQQSGAETKADHYSNSFTGWTNRKPLLRRVPISSRRGVAASIFLRRREMVMSMVRS